jgi:hypothetical protein
VTASVNPIEAAAADFGRHIAGGGGWALGLEVAACVQPNVDNGRPPRNRGDRPGFAKVSATAFATKAGTTHNRVMRYYEAWQRAAADGIVNPATDLTPTDWNDVEQIPEGYAWERQVDESTGEVTDPGYYDGSPAVGKHVSDDRRELLTAAATAAGVGRSKVIDVGSNPNAVAVALEADPAFAAAVEDARRRNSNAVSAATEGLRARLPEPPFDTPPHPYPGASAHEARMDVERDIASLHDVIGRFGRHDAEHLTPHADRLEQEHLMLGLVAARPPGAPADASSITDHAGEAS